ncbi:MAG: META domain-containing protein [Gemmatimonadales bacterium]
MTSQRQLIVLLIAVVGCSPRPPAQDEPPAGEPPRAAALQPAAAPITDQDWILVALGERAAPLGADDRPLTLRLDSGASRAVGFAGCNRYSGNYTLTGDSLRFGPAISTKMSCGTSDAVERSYLAMLPLVVTHAVADDTLTLNGPDGALARFRRQ